MEGRKLCSYEWGLTMRECHFPTSARGPEKSGFNNVFLLTPRIYGRSMRRGWSKVVSSGAIDTRIARFFSISVSGHVFD
jgi:hypothetical protein